MSENNSGCGMYGFLLAGGLAGLIATAPVPEKQTSIEERYNLPKEIVVKSTTTNFEERVIDILDKDGNPTGKVASVKVIHPNEIDFSEDFKIETDRYKIVKDDDWIPSRLIGHTLSCISKAIFFESGIGWGLDEKRTRAIVSMLENNKNIKDITVRINHNEGFYDWYRMMTEDKLTEKNHFLYRLIIGTIESFGEEIFAEFFRGDYYNPLTRTTVLYSNIESIGAHELGHNVDIDRFSDQWIYQLARIIPPVMVYQERQASQNAKEIMSKEDEYQFRRYLIPAFYTYLLGATLSILSLLYNKKDD